jgi:hypothetical protein
MDTSKIDQVYNKYKDLDNTEEPGQLTLKAASSEQDSMSALYDKYKNYIDLDEPLTQKVPVSQYDKGFVFGENPETRFAQRQGKFDEFGNAAGRVATNFLPGIIGSIAGIADVPDWFAGVNDQNEEVGNALTRWANERKRKTNEELFPIYQQDQTPGVHLGSSEWWFENGSGVVESAAEFAALGFGLGSMITKGLTAVKWLAAVDGATGGAALNAAGQTIGVATNAFLLNQAESILDATQTYDDELKKNMSLVQEGKLTEHEAKVNAAQAASHSININRANILLNMTSVGSIMRGSRFSRALKSTMSSPTKIALEAAQEYGEETINYYSGQRAMEMGEARRQGKEYTGQSFKKLIDDMSSAEGFEAGFLGALGGVMQTGFVEGINKMKKSNEAETKFALEQQEILASFKNLVETKKAHNILTTATAIDAHNSIITAKETLEKKINADIIAGNEPDATDIQKVKEYDRELVVAQALHNFTRGTTEYLEQAYNDIINMSPEQAKENGFEDAQLDEKSPLFYKTKAKETLNTVLTLEKAYNKAQKYMNTAELLELKGAEFFLNKDLQEATAQLSEKAIPATAAINAMLSSKPKTAKGIAPVLATESIDLPAVDSETEKLRKEAAQLPSVKEYITNKKHIAALQKGIDKMITQYEHATSSEVQDAMRKKVKEEQELVKEVLRKARANSAKAGQTVKAQEALAAEAVNEITGKAPVTEERKVILVKLMKLAQEVAKGNRISTEDTSFAMMPENINEFNQYKEKATLQQKANKANNTSKKVEGYNPNVTTETDVVQLVAQVESIEKFNLEAELLKSDKSTIDKRSHQAFNIMAWLNRAYKTVMDPTSMTGAKVDVDNELANVTSIQALDNRNLDEGDEVVLKLDETAVIAADVMETDAQGKPQKITVTMPWKEFQIKYAATHGPGTLNYTTVAPIGIYRKGVLMGHVHEPNWITSDNTQMDPSIDRSYLHSIRTKILEAKEVKTTVRKRTNGKLFIDHTKKLSPASKNIIDPSVQYAIVYNGTLTTARTTKSEVHKLNILNKSQANKEGTVYAILPIRHKTKTKEAAYWAVPMIPPRLSEDMIRSASMAVRIFYKVKESDVKSTAALSPEELVIYNQIKTFNPIAETGAGVGGYDIATTTGLKNYLNLFIYAEHTKNTTDQSLSTFLKSPDVTEDYYATEVGMNNSGVFFGSGTRGIVSRNDKTLDEFIAAWENHLKNLYTHTALDYMETSVKVPLLNSENKIVSSHDNYASFMKAELLTTNVMSKNIAPEGEPANYVHTIQPIVEFDTTWAGITVNPKPAVNTPKPYTQQDAKTLKEIEKKLNELKALQSRSKLNSIKEVKGEDGVRSTFELVEFELDNATKYKTIQRFATRADAEKAIDTVFEPLIKAQEARKGTPTTAKPTVPVTAATKPASSTPAATIVWTAEEQAKINEREKKLKEQEAAQQIDEQDVANGIAILKQKLLKDRNKTKDNLEQVDNLEELPETLFTITPENVIPDRYKIKGMSYAQQRSLVNFLAARYNTITNKALSEGKSVKDNFKAVVDNMEAFFKEMKEASLEDYDDAYHRQAFAATVLDNWSTVKELFAYNLRVAYKYDITKSRKAKSSETSTDDEAHALNPWAYDSIKKDPASNLTPEFIRFLGLIPNTDSPSSVPGITFDYYDPYEVYRKISAILVDLPPDLDIMLATLEAYLENAPNSLDANMINSVLVALTTKANKQEKAMFVSTSSKRSARMHHVYQIATRDSNGKISGHSSQIVDDNASSKARVLREEWKVNLQFKESEKAGLIVTEDDIEGTTIFDRKIAGDLSREFLSPKTTEEKQNFPLQEWLAQVGIILSDRGFRTLQEKGFKIKGFGTLPYDQLFISARSPFKKIATQLKAISNKADDAGLPLNTAVDNSTFMRADFWQKIAAFEAPFNDVVHSNTHKSGDSWVYSFADTEYVTSRATKFNSEDIEFLTGLANRPYSRSNWWLTNVLKLDASGNYVRDAEGNVVLSPTNTLTEDMEFSTIGLEPMIKKGVYRGAAKELSELSPLEHEVVKNMFYQNTGNTTSRFLYPTLGDKERVIHMNTPRAPIELEETGELAESTVDRVMKYVVLPEIERMLAYSDNHNINGYTEGSKLFMSFLNLNKLNVFNEDGSIRKDVLTDAGTLTAVKEVIKNQLDLEIAVKLAQWSEFGFIVPGVDGQYKFSEHREGFDNTYLNSIRSKLVGISEAALIKYAASEMVVAYRINTASVFQNISGDPVTAFKSKTKIDATTSVEQQGLDRKQQAADTWDNLTKRLSSEASPGKDGAAPLNATYRVGAINDIYLPSLVLDRIMELDPKLGKKGKDYAWQEISNAVEWITVPEKLRFLEEHGKLTPAQLEKIPAILKRYNEGKKLDLDQLQLVLQVDKPIAVGTRIDAKSGVETKVLIKSAAFTLIPQLIAGTELVHVEKMMQDSKIDRLVFKSAMKQGGPKVFKQVFDEEGNFIPGTVLEEDDWFDISRHTLKLQQETPIKQDTVINRVSQATKLAFVDIMASKGFVMPELEGELTAKELLSNFNKTWGDLYEISRQSLLDQLGIAPVDFNQPFNWKPDPKKLAALLDSELLSGGYSAQELDALSLDIVTDKYGNKVGKFRMPIWALPKSGKLEAFLNSIIDNRIVKQKMNGYSFVLGSEAGFSFKKEEGKEQIIKEIETVDETLKSSILFSTKFDGSRLKPALDNNGYHQVVMPWKFKASLGDISTIVDGKKVIDFNKISPELMKALGMRIPGQGRNSQAALEIVGFLPSWAGDTIIAPADFVTQMGADFDIDKLYVYLHNHEEDTSGNMTKVSSAAAPRMSKIKSPNPGDPSPMPVRESFKSNQQYKKAYSAWVIGEEVKDAARIAYNEEYNKAHLALNSAKKKHLQNKILDIHLSILTNLKDKFIQASLIQPTETELLSKLADRLDDIKAKSKALNNKGSNVDFADPMSDMAQTQKYIDAVAASTSIEVFASQNTFNALLQQGEELELVAYKFPDGKEVLSYIRFGDEKFKGKTLGQPLTLNGKTYKSTLLNYLLSAAVDNTKDPILHRLGINKGTINMAAFLTQAGFSIEATVAFISQPAIQEYVKQLSIHKENESKAFKAVDAIFKFNATLEESFLNKESVTTKTGTVTIDDIMADDLIPLNAIDQFTDMEMKEDERAKFDGTFWSFYTPSVTRLIKQIEEGESAADYTKMQYAMLSKFRQIMNREVKTLKNVQAMSNVDTKGPGKDLFTSLSKQDTFVSLLGGKLNGVESLFGSFKYYTGQEIPDLGYVEIDSTNQLYFRPTTPAGYAMAYGVVTNNAIWKPFFIYDSAPVRVLINDVKEHIRPVDEDAYRAAAEVDRKIFNQIRNAMYSSKAVTNQQDLNRTRKFLLTDYETIIRDVNGNPVVDENNQVVVEKHMSLASIFKAVQNDPVVKNSKFLNNLYVSLGKGAKAPKSLLFKKQEVDSWTNFEISSDVKQLLNEPQILGVFNGITYTTDLFIKHLALSSVISSTNALQYEMAQYIPLHLWENAQVPDALYNFDFTDFMLRPKFPNRQNSPTNFTVQYVQHNPDLVVHQLKELEEHVTDGTQVVINTYPEEINFGSMQQLEPVPTLVKFQLQSSAFDGVFPTFFTVKQGVEKAALYILTDPDLHLYERISTLGGSNVHEFNNDNENQTSLYASNNLPIDNTDAVVIHREGPKPETADRKGALSTEETRRRQKLLQTFGINQGDHILSRDEVNDALLRVATLAAAKKDPANFALVEFLTQTLPKFPDLVIKAGRASDNEGKPAVAEIVSPASGSDLTITYNFPLVSTEEHMTLTLTHELVHGVTIAGIRDIENKMAMVTAGKYKLTTKDQEMVEVYGRLNNLLNDYRAIAYNGKTYEQAAAEVKGTSAYNALIYPTKNIQEFVVGILTQPVLRQRLQELAYDKEGKVTFWDKFMKILNKLWKAFGVEKDSTVGKALNDIMKLTSVTSIKANTASVSNKQTALKQQQQATQKVTDKPGDVLELSTKGEIVAPTSSAVTKKESIDDAIPADVVRGLFKKRKDLLESLPIYSDDLTGADESAAVEVDLDEPIAKVQPKLSRKTNTAKFDALVQERKAALSQLYSRLRELRSELDKTSNTEVIKTIKKRIKNVEQNMTTVRNEIMEAGKLLKIDDLLPIGEQALNQVDMLLVDPSGLDFKDIEDLSRIVSLWKNAVDNFLAPEDRLIQGLVIKFNSVKNKAEYQELLLEEVKKKKIIEWTEHATGKTQNPLTYFAPTKDASTREAYTLSLDNGSHVILKTAARHIEEAEVLARAAYIDEAKALKKLDDAVNNKRHLVGKNYEKFMTEKGTLVLPQSDTYLDAKHKITTLAKAAEQAGETKRAAAYWAKYIQFIRANEIVFDIRKLVNLPEFADDFKADAGTLEKVLKDALGEFEYEKQLAKALKKYQLYKADLEIFQDELEMEDISDEDKAIRIKAWEDVNSLAKYFDYRNDLTVKGAPKNGYKYAISVPKAVDNKGNDTGFYSKEFKALQADRDVAALHNHVVNLVHKMNKFLPPAVGRNFRADSLPALQKAILETYKTDGMLKAATALWDGLKTGFGSGNMQKDLFGNIEANRYLSIGFETITEKQKKLLEEKKAAYARINSIHIKKVPAEVVAKLQQEAQLEVKNTTSTDLKSILGVYTAAMIDFKHKAVIEDALRLGEAVFNKNLKEVKLNSQGDVLTKDNVIQTKEAGESLPQLKKMFKYTLDRFYGVPLEVVGKTKTKIHTSTEKAEIEVLENEKKQYQVELEGTTDEVKKARLQAKIGIVDELIDKVGDGRVVTTSGMVDNLINLITIKGIGWNPFSGITNLGYGTVSNMIEASADFYFNEKEISFGYKTLLNSVARSWSFGTVEANNAIKLKNMMTEFDIVQSSANDMLGGDENNVLSKTAKLAHWSHFQQTSEYLNQGAIFVAMMKRHKVAMKDGKMSDLWEAFGATGEWDTKRFGEQHGTISQKELAKVIVKINEAIRKTHGNYAQKRSIMVKGNIPGKLLTVFRRWALEGIQTRFGDQDVNIDGQTIKGRYKSYGGSSSAIAGIAIGSLILPGVGTVLGGAIGTAYGKFRPNTARFKEGFEKTSQLEELALETKYLIRKLSLGLAYSNVTLDEKFTTVDAQNLRRNFTEIAIGVYLMGLIAVIKALKEDEDDEDTLFALNYSLNTLGRIQQDIGFYSDPVSFQAILRDPIPAAGLLEDVINWSRATGEYIGGVEGADEKLKKRSIKMLPFLRQYYTTEDLGTVER